ncbi:MAG: TonB-dependent receptor plug domain-containing protein [Cyclobacteriaceae bacterium]
MRLLAFLCFFGASFLGFTQQKIVGQLLDQEDQPIIGAVIQITSTQSTAISLEEGRFELDYIGAFPITLSISHIAYENLVLEVNTLTPGIIRLVAGTNQLEEIEVIDDSPFERQQQNELIISAQSAIALPSAFGDFSKVLATMPGVSSNNELSSAYNVRGGNFDENLVYVNDMPIYRPFLANTGRQEGLSFVNADLVQDISFFAGGWEAKYGDKLSSSLNINYRKPSKFGGNAAIGMLGGAVTVGGNLNEQGSYLVGIRHRDSRYLLNTLEVNGQYFPKFTDVQTLLTYDFEGNKRTEVSWLSSYARNRYQTFPISQETDFGSVARTFRLQTGFQGQENLNYDTYQSGVKVTRWFKPKFRTHLILSGVITQERENYEVEGAYRLCDVDNDLSSSNFDKCQLIRGIGSNYDYGRNALKALIGTGELRNEWLIDLHNVVEFGAGVSWQDVQDHLYEYSLADSADYVSVTSRTENQLDINSTESFGYVQYGHFSKDSSHQINVGIRGNYRSLSKEMLWSPRVQYQWRPTWKVPSRINVSAGLYQQHPFYREMRDRSGEINMEVRAQKSMHVIGGLDQFHTFWNRPFVFTTQLYYKRIWDINPYEIDNVRLRYFADNMAAGYAYGGDFRINGEFIEGTQSWFSIGYLKTEEDLAGDGLGLIRRPTDQRLMLGAFFEDHMPRDPSWRVYLNLLLASGFPFGPPGNVQYRNAFQGDEYYRADIGLSKEIGLKSKMLNQLSIRLEVLNAFAADNTISYTWINDVHNNSFAIPNSLSARYFNLKIMTSF